MAANLEVLREQTRQLAEQFRQNGQPEIADTLETGPVVVFNDQAIIARKLGLEQFSKPTIGARQLISQDLKEVVAKQIDRFIEKYGFHREVYPRLSDGEATAQYRRDFGLPESVFQPAEYAGRFDTVLVIEPRISLSRKYAIAGIREWIDTSAITDSTKYPDTPPYLTFTHDAQKYRPYSVKQALTMFAEDEVGIPLNEVTDHYLLLPEDFGKRGMVGMDAAGSRSGGGDVPCLYLLRGGPGVYADFIDDPARHWGTGSRGKEVIKLGV